MVFVCIYDIYHTPHATETDMCSWGRIISGPKIVLVHDNSHATESKENMQWKIL